MPHSTRSSGSTATLRRWLDQLGEVSDEPGQLTRTFLSPAMRRANELVGGWMRESGLAVREDVTGNLIGRREATDPALEVGKCRPRTLVLGSHLDTVRNAGRFDGPVGVLVPILAVAELERRGVRLPFAIEVVGFSEEEGVRFSPPYVGSKGYTGCLSAADLQARDAEGRSVAQVLAAHQGRPVQVGRRRAARRDLLGYLEVHIEQGPVLESKGLAVGTVSAIASQYRGVLRFRGKAGHAGTTPMNLRSDALTGAAEFIVAAEKFAQAHSPLVVTVGTVEVPGGASNVIPGEVKLSLDVRHPSALRGKRALDKLLAIARRIAGRRGLRCDWRRTLQQSATISSPALTSLLAASVRTIQRRNLSLFSGAGHDAVVLARVTDVAMLFVRCRGGLSHHPDEYASPKDLSVALEVVIEFIERLAKKERVSLLA